MRYYELIDRKKDHKCDLCRKRIEKGNLYVEIMSELDDWNVPREDLEHGPFQTFRRHINCDKAWKMISELFGDGDSFCYFYDGKKGAIFEQLKYNEVSPSDFEDPDLVRSFLVRLGLSKEAKA